MQQCIVCHTPTFACGFGAQLANYCLISDGLVTNVVNGYGSGSTLQDIVLTPEPAPTKFDHGKLFVFAGRSRLQARGTKCHGSLVTLVTTSWSGLGLVSFKRNRPNCCDEDSIGVAARAGHVRDGLAGVIAASRWCDSRVAVAVLPIIVSLNSSLLKPIINMCFCRYSLL